MKLPSQKKVMREDVKAIASEIGPLIDTLNSFMETVYLAMNKNMTFTENVACQVKEFTYNTPSTYPAGVADYKFMSELKTKAYGLIPLQVVERLNYTPAEGPVYIPWVEENGSIVLKTIKGLEADKSYTVRVLVT